MLILSKVLSLYLGVDSRLRFVWTQDLENCIFLVENRLLEFIWWLRIVSLNEITLVLLSLKLLTSLMIVSISSQSSEALTVRSRKP